MFADTGYVDDLPSATTLTNSCVEVVGDLSGRADLVADGRLQIRVSATYAGVSGQAVCGVLTTGTSTLTATLFALHDRPLPLS